MEFSIKLLAILSGWSIVNIEGSLLCYIFFKKVIISLKIVFAIAISAGPDEMPHNAAFNLGLHCLQKYPLRGFRSSKGQVLKSH